MRMENKLRCHLPTLNIRVVCILWLVTKWLLHVMSSIFHTFLLNAIHISHKYTPLAWSTLLIVHRSEAEKDSCQPLPDTTTTLSSLPQTQVERLPALPPAAGTPLALSPSAAAAAIASVPTHHPFSFSRRQKSPFPHKCWEFSSNTHKQIDRRWGGGENLTKVFFYQT